MLLTDDMTHRFQAISKATEDILVSAHGLRSNLAPGHPPFFQKQGELSAEENERTSIAAAVRVYGTDSPLLHLWTMLRAVEALSVAWTGKRPVVEAMVVKPVPPVEAETKPGEAL